MERDRKKQPPEEIIKGVANSRPRFVVIDGAPSAIKTPEQARDEYLRKKANRGAKDKTKSGEGKKGKKGKSQK